MGPPLSLTPQTFTVRYEAECDREKQNISRRSSSLYRRLSQVAKVDDDFSMVFGEPTTLTASWILLHSKTHTAGQDGLATKWTLRATPTTEAPVKTITCSAATTAQHFVRMVTKAFQPDTTAESLLERVDTEYELCTDGTAAPWLFRPLEAKSIAVKVGDGDSAETAVYDFEITCSAPAIFRLDNKDSRTIEVASTKMDPGEHGIERWKNGCLRPFAPSWVRSAWEGQQVLD